MNESLSRITHEISKSTELRDRLVERAHGWTEELARLVKVHLGSDHVGDYSKLLSADLTPEQCIEVNRVLESLNQIATVLRMLNTGKSAEYIEGASGEILRDIFAGLDPRLEKKMELRTQYEQQVQFLRETKMIEEREGVWGIRGIDHVFYPVPTYEEVRARVGSKQDLVHRKLEQGFNRMILVPFGMSLKDYYEKLRAALVEWNASLEKKIFSGESPLAMDRVVGFGDQQETLLYEPTLFEEGDHFRNAQLSDGKTKKQIMNERGAWQVAFLETDTETGSFNVEERIPWSKQGFKPMNMVLAELQHPTSAHAGEQGMNPEQMLLMHVIELMERRQYVGIVFGRSDVCLGVKKRSPYQNVHVKTNSHTQCIEVYKTPFLKSEAYESYRTVVTV